VRAESVRLTSLSRRHSVTPKGPLIFIGSLALIAGYAYLSGTPLMWFPFLGIGVATVVGSLFWSARAYSDWLNPLVILVSSAVIRIGLPWLFLFWMKPPSDFDWLSPAFDYWDEGLGLALFGLVSALLGWLLTPGSFLASARRRLARLASGFPFDSRVMTLSVVFTLAGVVLVAIFLKANYLQPIDAVTSGIIRCQTCRIDATSRYSFLGEGFLVYGSAALSIYLLLRVGVRARIGLLPVLLATLIMTIFGQRVGALSPLAFGLLAVWYRRFPRRIKISRALLAGTALLLLATIYASFVLVYRGQSGLTGALDSLSVNSVLEYLRFSVWSELGFLHPFAVAEAFGPGVLHGQTFPALGGFVTGAFLGIESIRPGVFVVAKLTESPVEWGIHTGLIVDLFMNVGLIAVLIGCAMFGMILRYFYEGFRANRDAPLVVFIYSIVLWRMIWIFYEWIGEIFSLFISVTFVAALMVGTKLLPSGREGSERRLRFAPSRQL
jgi:hypothetical protein